MKILYIEPYDAGSHAAFTRTLTTIDADWTELTLPGRHWKWRMRGAVPYFVHASREVFDAHYDLVFASSYVPLAELYGLAPLADTPSVLYFHENQLTYPNRTNDERDHHYGMTQLVSALAATACWFNSAYNRDAFLDAGAALLSRMPDAVAPGWIERIRDKSRVMPVPVLLSDEPLAPPRQDGPPTLLWNHRWEHDKDPEAFFEALEVVADRGVDFRLIVCGQRYASWPAVFDRAQVRFADQIVHFGPADRSTYLDLLARADVAVSTARHEFFGVAMIEATHFGAHPLVPDALAYPEIFPAAFRYDRPQLADRLAALLTQPEPLRADRRDSTSRYGAKLLDEYREALQRISKAR